MRAWKKKCIVWLCVLALAWGVTTQYTERGLADGLGLSGGLQIEVTPEMESTPETGVTPETESTPETGVTPETESTPETGVTPETGSTPETEVTPEPESTPEPEDPPLLGTYPGTPSPAPTAPCYALTLGNRTIGDGELLEYTAVSPVFAGRDLPEGMYAGEIQLELTGPVVVESGGCLAVGTLSIGSDAEISPVIRGTLTEEGIIVVKAGGQLKLTQVVAETTGTGLLIVQEPGGLVTMTASEIPEGLVRWAPPVVNNQNDAPDDLWLEEGTALTPAQLPASLRTNLQYRGTETREEIQVVWDMADYAGQTTGEYILTGRFLDAAGEELASSLPLTLTVHWYSPQTLAVTQALWKGDQACSASFLLLELPEHAEVWGEISSDGGKTWSRWPAFDYTTQEDGTVWCTFYELENQPHSYRVVAEHLWEPSFWATKAFCLPEDDGGDDLDGNRGGSTSPDTPEREPAPVTTPASTSRPSQASEPVVALAASEEDEETELPPAGVEATAVPEESGDLEDIAVPEDTAMPEETLRPEDGAALPVAQQILLVAGGVAFCTGICLAVAGVGPFRRRKKQR